MTVNLTEKITENLHEAGQREWLETKSPGTVSEIFDADPSYTSRGCISQARSVAELLQTYMDVSNQ